MEYASRVSPVFGCPSCAAKEPPETRRERIRAARGAASINGKHEALKAEYLAKAEAAQAAVAAAKAERAKASLARMEARLEKEKAQQAKRDDKLAKREEKEKAESQQWGVQLPKGVKCNGKSAPTVAELDAALDSIQRDRAAIAQVDAAFAKMPHRTRCTCCGTSEGELVETWDGKHFCGTCQFATLRTGYCTIHNTEHYPELSGVPRIPLWEYPRALLGLDPERLRHMESASEG